MDAVDSPGSPGLNFVQLGELLRALISSGRIAGMTVCIYDPDLDAHGKFARPIVGMLAGALRS
jgi:arginase